MEQKGFKGNLIRFLKPIGKPPWKHALKSIFLMVLACLLAKFIGFDQGIKLIVFTTLIATILIDVQFPLRKIIPLTFIGFLITFLAFISSSLALTSLPVFLFFAVVWAFFSLSLYIFSETMGLFGFLIFSGYFLSVLLVNPEVSTWDLALYIIFAYLIGSFLFIPKFLGRKEDLLNMISSPFRPRTSLEHVLSVREALSDLPIDRRDYELFQVGTFLVGLREYSKIVLIKLSGKSRDLFQNFMDTANKTSQEIASSVKRDPNPVPLGLLDQKIESMEKKLTSDPSGNTVVRLSKDIQKIFTRTNILLQAEYPSLEKNMTYLASTSFKNVLSANFNLNNMYIRHALRFTLALSLGLLTVYLVHDPDIIWIIIGILIIFKPDVTSTLNNLILRVSFNFIAIILAILIGLIFPNSLLIMIGFLMLVLFRTFYQTQMGLSIMAFSVFVVFICPTGFLCENALAKLFYVGIGAIIAFICAYLILPSKMTINLPEQISKTIRANREYLNTVIPHKEMSYNNDLAVSCFRNYILEEKNLESAIKKIGDTFDDVYMDVDLYNRLNTCNKKLAADLTAVATILESSEYLPDLDRFKEQVINALNELALSVEKNVILPKANIDVLELNSEDNKFPDDLENYLNVIVYDMRHFQNEVEWGFKVRAFKKYRNII
ncbi:MAG: FUSC family protein [Methanobacterium sp.]